MGALPHTFWFKMILALALGTLCLFGFRNGIAARFAQLRVARAMGIFVGGRLALFVLAFFVLKLPLPFDVTKHFFPQGTRVLAGAVPILDFSTSYNVGLPYILAAALALVRSPVSLCLFMIAAESLAFLLLHQRFKKPLPELFFLWTLSPVSIVYVALGAQDDALLLLLGVVLICLSARARSGAATFAVLLGFLCTKLLALLFVPSALVSNFRRNLGALVVLTVSCGLITYLSLVHGIPLLGGSGEIGTVTSGNLYSLASLNQALTLKDGGSPSVAMYIPLCLGIGTLVIMALREGQQSPVEHLRRLGLAGATFLLLSPKTFGTYAVIFLPGLLALSLTSSRRYLTAHLLIYYPLFVIESSLLWSLPQPRGHGLLLGVDVVLVLFNAGLIWTELNSKRGVRLPSEGQTASGL